MTSIVQQSRNFNASAVALPAQPDDANTLLIVLEDKAATSYVGSYGVISGPNGSQVWTKIGGLFPSNPDNATGWIEEWQLVGPFDTVGSIVYSAGGRSAPKFDAHVMEIQA